MHKPSSPLSAALPISAGSGQQAFASPGLVPVRGRSDARRRAHDTGSGGSVAIDLVPDGAAARARLLVHLEDTGLRPWSLGAWLGGRPRRQQRTHWTVELLDLQGRRLLSIADAVAVVDLTLPPATYEVRASTAQERRQYTVALADGEIAALQPLQGERHA